MEKLIFTRDKLNRKDLAKRYVTILKSIDNAYTIALDAPWGSGKSKVIDFMCHDFEKDNDIYIKYNAWENDYTNEPFLSLLNHIFNVVKQNNTAEIKLNKIKNIAIKASKISAKSLTKGIGNYFIGSESVKELESLSREVTKSLISKTTEYTSSIFDELDESKESRKKFIEELKNTIGKVLKTTKKNKIYIIIDELDRCKPSFAIELLENIKHLFEMDEIIFLIAVDTKQLAESLKAVYGNGFNAETYLHRFFNFELHLDTPRSSEYIYEKLIQLDCHNDTGLNCLIYGYTHFQLTLRDIERIITEAKIIKELNISNYNVSLHILFPLIILKYKFKDIYDSLKASSFNRLFADTYLLIRSKKNIRLENFIIEIAVYILEGAVGNKIEECSTNKIDSQTINQIKMLEESSIF